jgi:hypothetical protein
MATYTWKINSLTTLPSQNGQADVVVLAEYIYSGNDGVNTINFTGSQSFTYTEGLFTPFNELTEPMIIKWVQNSLTEQGLCLMKNSMDNQLKIAATTFVYPSNQPLPWA